MPFSDRLRNVRRGAQERREAREEAPSLRDRARGVVRGQRGELRDTREEAGKLRDENLRDVVAAGGAAAASTVRRAVDTAAAAGSGDGSGDTSAMFARAEENVTAAPPIDATLDPVTSPQDLASFVTGGSGTAGAPGANERGAGMAEFVMGSDPTDTGGMAEFVMGSSPRDDPMTDLVMGNGSAEGSYMEDLVMGRGADEDARLGVEALIPGSEAQDRDDRGGVDELVTGWEGDW